MKSGNLFGDSRFYAFVGKHGAEQGQVAMAQTPGGLVRQLSSTWT
jgi:hypothetical protein